MFGGTGVATGLLSSFKDVGEDVTPMVDVLSERAPAVLAAMAVIAPAYTPDHTLAAKHSSQTAETSPGSGVEIKMSEPKRDRAPTIDPVCGSSDKSPTRRARANTAQRVVGLGEPEAAHVATPVHMAAAKPPRRKTDKRAPEPKGERQLT